MIHCSNVTFKYAGQSNEALHIDEFVIQEGECVVLCGESGSGKTTCTRLFNGLIPEYSEGTFSGFCQVDFCQVGVHSVEEFSTSVGSVFQNPSTQFFHKEVMNELVFPCENQGLPIEEITKRLNETVALFGIETLLSKQLMHLSGGERQRVAMATAYMQSPKVMILDEPTANLDEAGIQLVAQSLATLKKSGMTIVIAEHRLNFLKDIADRYVYFHNGRIEQVWDKEEFLKLTDEYRLEKGLRSSLSVTLSRSTKQTGLSNGVTIQDVVLRAGDCNVQHIPYLHFEPNCIHAIMGENGCGKTTLARTISGLLPLRSGSISFDGVPLTMKRLQNMTTMVRQDVRMQLFASSVDKEVRLGNIQHERVEEMLDTLSLKSLLSQHPQALSGGQQQRVVIANALLSNKKIWIFDEPTSGMDATQLHCFASVLTQLTSPDRIILVITHDEELVSLCCDRVTSLSRRAH